MDTPESAYLINVSRGPLVQDRALLKALEQRQIAGAVLDVFDEEPLPADHPLGELDNLHRHSPYIGAEPTGGDRGGIHLEPEEVREREDNSKESLTSKESIEVHSLRDHGPQSLVNQADGGEQDDTPEKRVEAGSQQDAVEAGS